MGSIGTGPGAKSLVAYRVLTRDTLIFAGAIDPVELTDAPALRIVGAHPFHEDSVAVLIDAPTVARNFGHPADTLEPGSTIGRCLVQEPFTSFVDEHTVC